MQKCSALKQCVNVCNFIDCLGASCSRCLMRSLKSSMGWPPKMAPSQGWTLLLAVGWEMSWSCCLEYLSISSLCGFHFSPHARLVLSSVPGWTYLQTQAEAANFLYPSVRSSSTALPFQNCPQDRPYSRGKELDCATWLRQGSSCIYKEGRNWWRQHLKTSEKKSSLLLCFPNEVIIIHLFYHHSTVCSR